MKHNFRYLILAVLLSGATATLAAEADAEKTAKPAASKTSSANKDWSWQPVATPQVPSVQQKKWVRSPIDAFVLAKLEESSVKPSAEASRAAFIRRATLDAWGLIPSTEEVNAFVNDKSPDAYEKLVDRLLSSPRYGERQARKWLDLARYADSTGFQGDQTRPSMWRYRDYVINSFNEDKPYDRFVKEQLAGDELYPGDTNALVATGFMAGFPDNKNSRDLIQRKYQITTDITDTVGTAILGTTFECARCHNHKADKISQKDYFALQAFFSNVSAVDNIPAPRGSIEARYEQDKAKWEEATKEIRAKRAAIIEPLRAAAEQYHKERYLSDSRDSIFKPKNEWNATDRWVHHRLANVTTDEDLGAYLRVSGESKENPEYVAENESKWLEYKKLTDDLKKFDKLKPAKGSNTISAMTELGYADAPSSFVFFGGNHERPLDEVQPAFPAALTSEKPQIIPTSISSGRRTALANWIASPQNPLTARVFVNRVWDQYFGTGIVRTVSDFGRAGDKPSNPELLEYLASNFVKQGWSVKKLHKEILLSSVYRQSSDYREDAYKADPENKLLAVFPRKRLDAEQIRDSLLVASGKLEDKVGGPSVMPPVPSNLNAGALWQVSGDKQDYNRRSLYVFTRRSVPYPLLATFDMASAQQVHSKRDVTTTPLQALALVNSDIVFEWSQSLAGKVISEAGGNETAQIEKLYQILFARSPDKAEKATLTAFLANHEKIIKAKLKDADGRLALAVPVGLKDTQQLDPVRASAFVDLVHTVANSNEFSYRF
ncbi:DUF1549 and DUF1553 domain-containing protein [Methylobacillus gramineus]|uniref:DUF1549 and DUF1553 domain-containing protein n=1 Tax=Methylobacillus gramineus TaxID=755169 RepID=UPI001CFFD2DE|nr:DUF1549 and DUF1553 domain-containing protein [Methylobacillus gramineus]MCB5183602.1 DUF1549 and DUF1553 domain-containing protein [Methylobacillus gramineus]